MLQGKKTYIVALGIVLAAAGGFFAGELTMQEAIVQALTGLGLGTLRLGVKADKKAAQAVLEESAASIDGGGQ